MSLHHLLHLLHRFYHVLELIRYGNGFLGGGIVAAAIYLYKQQFPWQSMATFHLVGIKGGLIIFTYKGPLEHHSVFEYQLSYYSTLEYQLHPWRLLGFLILGGIIGMVLNSILPPAHRPTPNPPRDTVGSTEAMQDQPGTEKHDP